MPGDYRIRKKNVPQWCRRRTLPNRSYARPSGFHEVTKTKTGQLQQCSPRGTSSFLRAVGNCLGETGEVNSLLYTADKKPRVAEEGWYFLGLRSTDDASNEIDFFEAPRLRVYKENQLPAALSDTLSDPGNEYDVGSS